jgi:signal transduction histidine kinase
MGFNLSAFLNLLAKPPGDLIYHLVVSLALILTGCYALANLEESSRGKQARTTLIGCSILLILQIILFGLRFINPGSLNKNVNLVLITEHLAATLTIIWLIWTYAHQDKRFFLTGLGIFLTIALVILAGLIIFLVPYLPVLSSVNQSSLNLLWQAIALVVLMGGILLVIFKRPQQRVVMLLSMLLLAVGHSLQMLLQPEPQSGMGAVRFAQILSLPWVMVLIQRFSKDKIQQNKNQTGTEEGPAEQIIDNKAILVERLFGLNLSKSGEEKYQAVVRALSLSVVADVCYLIELADETDKVHILAGYDLIREVDLGPDTLAREDLPLILAAWKSNQALELTQDETKSRDLVTLALLIQYHSAGNVFAYPLGLIEKSLVGGVIFLSPYTGKNWGKPTTQFMDEIKDTLGQVLFSSNPLEQAELELKQASSQINILLQELERLHQAVLEKETLIQEKESIIKELKAKYQIEKMETVNNIQQMKAHVTELSSQLNYQKNAAKELEQLKTEIRQLTSEREQLSLALARANALVRDLQTQAGQTGPIRLSQQSQIISLDSIAANVRLRIAPLLGQREIDLEIHNPDGRQMIKTDPELLQTALTELLTNASLASRPGGAIELDQRLSFEMGMLTIQVTDYGNGLTDAEQKALFSAEYDSIPGIGNVQSVRNAIRAIRVLNGKIWLKSKKASYTTFRFLIPVRIID